MAHLTDCVEHGAAQSRRITGLPASWAEGQRPRSIVGPDGESSAAGSMVKVSTANLEQKSEAVIEAEVERRVRGRVAELRAALGTFDSLSGCFDNDLRTPRRAIEGLSNLLAERVSRLDPDSGPAVARVRAASQTLARALDDLMEFSRLTSGELHRGKVDPLALTGEVARRVDSEAAKRTPRQARMLRELHAGSAGGMLILAAGLLLIGVCAALL